MSLQSGRSWPDLPVPLVWRPKSPRVRCVEVRRSTETADSGHGFGFGGRKQQTAVVGGLACRWARWGGSSQLLKLHHYSTGSRKYTAVCARLSSHDVRSHTRRIATRYETDGCSCPAAAAQCRLISGVRRSPPAAEVYTGIHLDTRGRFTRPSLCIRVAPRGEARRLTDRHAASLPAVSPPPSSTSAGGLVLKQDGLEQRSPEPPLERRQYPAFVSGLETAIFYILMDIPTTRCRRLAFGHSFIDRFPFPISWPRLSLYS